MDNLQKMVSELINRGWSQNSLARQIGCAQSTMSEIANGVVTDPKHSIASAIIELYNSEVQ